MARLGILTNSYRYPTLEENLDAIVRDGLSCVQFEPTTAGIASTEEQLEQTTAARVNKALSDRGLAMVALSGTVNMIHPIPAARRAGMNRLTAIIRSCAAFGSAIVTLCTGTRDPNSMWRRHPDNDTPEAWSDLVASMRVAARIAEECGITLAFEPEVNNVVDSAGRAVRLIDEVGSDAVRVVMDPANIFHTGELPRMRELIDEAFTLVGPYIALAHAKDLDHDGDAGHLPAGRGMLDYAYYLSRLDASGFDGGVIMHGLSELEVPGCVEFLRGMAPASWRWSK